MEATDLLRYSLLRPTKLVYGGKRLALLATARIHTVPLLPDTCIWKLISFDVWDYFFLLIESRFIG